MQTYDWESRGFHVDISASKTYLVVKQEHEINAKELAICRHRRTYHHAGKVTSRCSHRLQNLYRRIRLQQRYKSSLPRPKDYSQSCHHSTTCSLRCIHPWSLKPLVLPFENYPRHPRPPDPTRERNPSNLHSSADRQVPMFETGT